MEDGDQKALINGAASFLLICAGLALLVYMVHGCVNAATSNQPAQARATGTYTRNICEDAYKTEVHAYEKKNPPYFDIHLSDKCFGGFVVLPAKWQSWQTQMLGNDPTDWVAYWAAGVQNPVGPESADQTNDQGHVTISVPKNELRLEGKGTLRFYRILGDADSTPVASTPNTAEPAATLSVPKPLHPVTPDFGANTEYSMTIEQCVRNGEMIDCWGFANNKLDDPTQLDLEYGNAVDDDGNSLQFGAARGTFMFDNNHRETLIHDINTKFHIRVDDPHLAAKTLTFNLTISWHSAENSLIFKNVPIEQ